MQNKRRNTPIRAALRSDSTPQPVVHDRLDALEGNLDLLQENIRPAFGDSSNLDAVVIKKRKDR